MSIFSKFKKKSNKEKDQIQLNSPAKGRVASIEESTDPTFSQKILGDGMVIFPEDGKIYAPCDGEVKSIFPTSHALTMTVEKNIKVLIHLGIDTVELEGEGFTSHVKNDDMVKKGDLLVTMDLDLIKEKGYSTEIIVILMEVDENAELEIRTGEKTTDDLALVLSNI